MREENFNERKKREAQGLGQVVSHDDDPLAPVGREGMDLGEAARPEPFDPGDLDPMHSGDSVESSPVSHLPASVSAAEIKRQSFPLDPYGGDK
jgi:hypothetical protein